MATKKPTSDDTTTADDPTLYSTPTTEDALTPEPILGTGGELYGDAHTTPDDAVINYPSDQDGVVTAPPEPTTPPLEDPDVVNPTDVSPGALSSPTNPLPKMDPAQSTMEATKDTDVGNPNDPATDPGGPPSASISGV